MADDLRTRLSAAIEQITSWVEVDYASISPGSDLTADLLDVIMATLDPGSESEADLGERMRHEPTGVYRLFWHSGGCSVAAVGMLDDGTRWYAPANWVHPAAGGLAATDWSRVKSAELIESYQGSRRKRPRKDAS